MARTAWWSAGQKHVLNTTLDSIRAAAAIGQRVGLVARWSVPRRPDDPTAYLRSVPQRDVTAVSDRVIFINIFMPTTVHIPDPLLKSVDRRAKALGISRNRLVVRALEEAVSVRSGWAPEFLQRLRQVDRDTSSAVDELLIAVTQARRSKEPRDL